VLRRLTFAGFEIRPDERQLLVDGNAAALGARAFDLLMCLVEHRDRIVSKDELQQHVWPGLVVEESNLTVHVATLRKLLGPQAITTIAGRGYRFTAMMAAEPNPAAARKPPPTPFGSGAEARTPTLSPPIDKPSLAVLPFANLSGDNAQDYFIDGVVDDITTALSRVRAFFVIARSSSFTYKGRVVDVPQVGRELGVRYVVEGSFRQAGARLRIGVQLVEAATGRLVWSQRFEGLREDIFELQDQITAQVVAAIEPKLMLAELELTRSKPTEKLQAYELCLRALSQLHHPSSRQEAEHTFELLAQAMAMDSGYLYAKALYCWAHTTASGARQITHKEAQRGLPIALEVLADHRDDPTALAYAGHSVAYLGRRHEQGLRALDRALALNPNSVPALCSSGWVRAYVGDADVAIDHFRQALRLNPMAPQHSHLLTGLGYAYLISGRLDEALSSLKQALLETPEWATMLLATVHCLARLDRWEEARTACAQLLRLVPYMRISNYRAMTPFVDPTFVETHTAMLEAAGIPP
jgi:TolB-like protein/Flp pilus assembly protein TadD